MITSFFKHGNELCLQQNASHKCDFFCSGLLLASCLYNIVTQLSSDNGDYLHFVVPLLHNRLNHMSHLASPLHQCSDVLNELDQLKGHMDSLFLQWTE